VSHIPRQQVSIDAFLRQRVSDPETLFDAKFTLDAQPLIWDDQETSGSGTTSTRTSATSSMTLTVAGSTAGKRTRQTFRRFNYQPAKSQLIFMTGTLGVDGGGTGITRAAGLFDDENGIYFIDKEGVINAVIRSSDTGSVVNNEVAQSSWSEDTMDGSGDANNPSGLTLDATKSQIIFFDFEWLGVGTVRMGFAINGTLYVVHKFHHANITAGVYMTTPCLPLRYEIENDGTGAASSLEQICSSVISEGGHNPKGLPQFHGTNGTHVECTTANTLFMVCGIRLSAAAIRSGIEMALNGVSILNETKGDYEWQLIHNPTMSNETWSAKTNSAMETTVGQASDPSTSTISGGHVIAGGFVTDGNSETLALKSTLSLGSAIDGTPDELVLAYRGLSANGNVQGTIMWKEF
jgi:hypothetical protein